MISKNVGIYMAIEFGTNNTTAILFRVWNRLSILQAYTFPQPDSEETANSICKICEHYDVVGCVLEVCDSGNVITTDKLKKLNIEVKEIKLDDNKISDIILNLKRDNTFLEKGFSVDMGCTQSFKDGLLKIWDVMENITYNVTNGWRISVKPSIPNEYINLFRCLLLMTTIERIEICQCEVCKRYLWKKKGSKYPFLSKISTMYDEENNDIDILNVALNDDLSQTYRVKIDTWIAGKDMSHQICKDCMVKILDKVKEGMSESLKEDN